MTNRRQPFGDSRSGFHAGETTATVSCDERRTRGEAVPGVLLFFREREPMHAARALRDGSLEIGRDASLDLAIEDNKVSRNHARIAFDGSTFSVRDLDSKNGTFVDGERIHGLRAAQSGSVVRVGGPLLLLCDDIGAFDPPVTVSDGVVQGPGMRIALEAVAEAVISGRSLLITGESGVGKEIAARAFHRAGRHPNGPFVAVNCGAIQEGLAERLLFGSCRGAYSGATDATGYVQAAHGGTLFLDEVAELHPEVQTKLLRVLETSEVTRLGASKGERVDLQVCAATWRDLRAEVAKGRFREDLYFRIGRPEVRLVPLRERVVEIPWLVANELASLDFPSGAIEAGSTFVEACIRRVWPGNIRELRSEVRRAAGAAAAKGRKLLVAGDLDPSAGVSFPRDTNAAHPPYPDDDIARALALESGNVARAAKRLGMDRSKVRRWIERHHVDVRVLGRATPSRGTE